MGTLFRVDTRQRVAKSPRIVLRMLSYYVELSVPAYGIPIEKCKYFQIRVCFMYDVSRAADQQHVLLGVALFTWMWEPL